VKIYRNTYDDGASIVAGYSYHASKREAVKEGHSRKPEMTYETDVLEVEISGKGIIDALNRYGSHPDNG
jgi:hypothetical protein